MLLIFSFISSGSLSIVQYLRGFYWGTRIPPASNLMDSSLSPPLFLLLSCFLSLLFIPTSVPMAELNIHLNCFEISQLPFIDSLHWYILISTVCWHSLSAVCWSLHSWHNFLAFTLTLRHTLKLYHPSYIPYFNNTVCQHNKLKGYVMN